MARKGEYKNSTPLKLYKGGNALNLRKNIDYSEMYESLDNLMVKDLHQMELYCEIGKTVCRRAEKGAAVAAAEYLSKHYPDARGFSPRNLRRMRDFYRTYEKYPSLLCRAMELSWTQNVVIMETDITMELREWYLRAAKQFGWSKTELTDSIANHAHDEITLAIEEEVCYVESQDEGKSNGVAKTIGNSILHLIRRFRCQMLKTKGGRRRWLIMSCPIFTEKRIAFMRC